MKSSYTFSQWTKDAGDFQGHIAINHNFKLLYNSNIWTSLVLENVTMEDLAILEFKCDESLDSPCLNITLSKAGTEDELTDLAIRASNSEN